VTTCLPTYPCICPHPQAAASRHASGTGLVHSRPCHVGCAALVLPWKVAEAGGGRWCAAMHWAWQALLGCQTRGCPKGQAGACGQSESGVGQGR
jgi:hypothetical protein